MSTSHREAERDDAHVPVMRPFAALRPAREHAGAVVAPPYDVVTAAEARAFAAGNPLSFLRVSRPEIDLPPETDPYAPAVYAQAGRNLDRLVQSGVLQRDPAPAFYAYRIAARGHVQTGVAAAASIAAYEAGRIRRHEHTRPDKETDRARQIEATGAQTSPVLLAHRSNDEIAAVLGAATRAQAAVTVTDRDGAAHSLWPIADAATVARLERAFEAGPALYIADGHHRSAAASRVRRARRAANSAHRGDEPYNSMLAVSFPDDELRILAYDRVVRDLGGRTPDALLARLAEDFTVAPMAAAERPDAPRIFAMYLAGRWYRLALRTPPSEGLAPAERLDVALLAAKVLAPVLGIEDPRTDPRIDFAGGSRGLAALTGRVDAGEMAVAFALHPTRLADLFAVADAGAVMPPKSTWFDPKLLDGLLAFPLD